MLEPIAVRSACRDQPDEADGKALGTAGEQLLYHTTRWGPTYVDGFLERYECDPGGCGETKVCEEPVFADQDREKLLVRFDELWGLAVCENWGIGWEDRAIYIYIYP